MAKKRKMERAGRTSVTGWISEQLKGRIEQFIEQYPTIRSESTLVSVALEDYLETAERTGIDVNYKPKRKADK